METKPVETSGVVRQQGDRLLAAIRPVAVRAQSVVGKVRALGYVSLGAGAVLWLLFFYPFASTSGWTWVPVGLLLTAFLLPGGILWLFALGLDQLILLPDRLVAMAGMGEVHAATLTDTAIAPTERRWLQRLWRLLRSVVDLRGLILDSKGLLLQYAAVIRLVNPWTLGAVLLAVLASFLLIAAAVLGALLTLML